MKGFGKRFRNNGLSKTQHVTMAEARFRDAAKQANGLLTLLKCLVVQTEGGVIEILNSTQALLEDGDALNIQEREDGFAMILTYVPAPEEDEPS